MPEGVSGTADFDAGQRETRRAGLDRFGTRASFSATHEASRGAIRRRIGRGNARYQRRRHR